MWNAERRVSHLSESCKDSTGKPKQYYDSYSDAQRAADIGLKERGVRLTAYRCSVCGKYHLTSRSRIGKKGKNR